MSCSCGYLERALQGNWENQGGNKLASIQAVEKLADWKITIKMRSMKQQIKQNRNERKW